MRARPTRRLFGVVLAAAVIYGFAANSLLVWLYAVSSMLLAMVPLGIAGPLIAASRLRRIDVTSIRSHGFDAPLVADHGRIFTGDELEIHLGDGIRLDQVLLGPLHTDKDVAIPARAAMLGATSVIHADLPMRGQVDIVAIDVVSTWPFGLLEVRRRAEIRAGLLVHPRYTIVDARRGTGAGVGGEDPQRKGQAEDVVGLREYRSGDSRRQIHWLTTARTGRLMVVERAAPTFAALQARLRLDPGADPGAVELAVFVTATLAASCTKAGRPFRLSLPDGPPEARRWNEAIARLARSRPTPSPLGRAVSAAIRADATGVIVESESGVVRLAPGADVAAVERVVEGLL